MGKNFFQEVCENKLSILFRVLRTCVLQKAFYERIRSRVEQSSFFI